MPVQRTSANIPEFGQTFAAQQDPVRPDIQPAVQNFLAASQLKDARDGNALTAKLQQARLQMDQLKLDPEIAALKAQTGKDVAATELATRKEAGVRPETFDLSKPIGGNLTKDEASIRAELIKSRDAAQNKLSLLDQKAQLKIQKEAPKAKAALDNTVREFDNMIAEANAIKLDPSLEAATGKSSYIPSLLNEGKRNVGARIDTLKSKTLLNVLSAMKQLSSQGASGFGALSEKEGETIKNSISSLDTKQDMPQFQASLDRFIAEIQAKKDSYLNTYNSTYGEAAAPNDKKAALRAKLGL